MNIFGDSITKSNSVCEYESIVLLDPETNFQSSLLEKTFDASLSPA